MNKQESAKLEMKSEQAWLRNYSSITKWYMDCQRSSPKVNDEDKNGIICFFKIIQVLPHRPVICCTHYSCYAKW